MAGNNLLTKQSFATKVSTTFKACSGISGVPESIMIGARGQTCLIAIASSCPFISGMQ